MPVDMRKVLSAAVLAAIKEAQSAPPTPARPKKARLTTGKALLVGAGVVTAGRVLAGPKAREMLESVQQRLEEAGGGRDDYPDAAAEEDLDDEYDDEPEAEVDDEPEAEEDLDDEPEDEPEAEADVDDEDDDEPEAEVDDEPAAGAEVDDEPDADVDGDEPDGDEDRVHGSEGRRRPQRSRTRARGRR